MQKFYENIKRLRIRGTVTFKEIAFGRLQVFRNNNPFGIYCLNRHTFVD